MHRCPNKSADAGDGGDMETWCVPVCRAMEAIKQGVLSEGGDALCGCAFVCCASLAMFFFIIYFDLPV